MSSPAGSSRRRRRLTATAAFGGNWNSYLLLLGAPFASAVVAKGIGSARVGSDPGVKTSTAAASAAAMATAHQTTDAPSPADAVRNDAGETDLVDSQYVVFSLVAVLYFLGAYVLNLSRFVRLDPCTTAHPQNCAAGIALPEIPAALLGLTSLAALTYVGQKAVEHGGLRVVTVTPSPVKANGTLTITLTNLSVTTRDSVSVVFTARDKTAEHAPPPVSVMEP